MSTITEIADFWTADYSNVFPNKDEASDRLFSMFAHPLIPFGAVVLYLLLSDSVFGWIRTTFNIQPKGTGLQMLTVTHSALLAIYSLWTFVGSVRIVAPYLQANGLYGSLCDADEQLWTVRGLGFWITHFYLSKFYEFLDTWIIILKGRKPMFLQTYHHAGVVLIMWTFAVTKNTGGGAVVLVLNSFIHTLMYTYYTFSAFGFGSALKPFLTQAQLLQFMVGIAMSLPCQFITGCNNNAQKLGLLAIHLYALGLIYLFYQFYVTTYNKRVKKQ